DPSRYGPGYDVLWLGAADAYKYVAVAEGRAFVADAAGHAWFGPNLSSLRLIGPTRGSVIADDEQRFYVVAGRDVLSVDMSGARKWLFTSSLPIQRVETDRAALYVSASTDPARPGSTNTIYRVPKDGGRTMLLYSAKPAPLEQNVISDGQSLFVDSLVQG